MNKFTNRIIKKKVYGIFSQDLIKVSKFQYTLYAIIFYILIS